MKPQHSITVAQFNLPITLYPDSFTISNKENTAPSFTFNCDLNNNVEVTVDGEVVVQRGVLSFTHAAEALLRKLLPTADANNKLKFIDNMHKAWGAIPRIEVEARNVVKTYDNETYIVASIYPSNATVISIDAINTHSIARHWIKEIVMKDVNDILKLVKK